MYCHFFHQSINGIFALSDGVEGRKGAYKVSVSVRNISQGYELIRQPCGCGQVQNLWSHKSSVSNPSVIKKDIAYSIGVTCFGFSGKNIQHWSIYEVMSSQAINRKSAKFCKHLFIKENWIYTMEVHVILYKPHSSELCWLHSHLISSQNEDETQDIPIAQQTVGSCVLNTCSYRRASSRITRARSLNITLRFSPVIIIPLVPDGRKPE